MPITPKPEFVARCTDRVDVQVDRNAAGDTTDDHGMAPRDFTGPAVFTGVACHLVNDGPGFVEMFGVQVPVRRWRALFPVALALDRNHRLVWRDPDRGGKVRYLYVVADSTMQILYCKADCYEHIRPSPP